LKLPIIINRTAAALAAAAIYEVFPGAELFGGGETDTGFFYQFFFPHPLPPIASKLIEEKIREIIREHRPLREAEMVARSAKELFLKEDHVAAVEMLGECEPKELVSVIQIGTFYDLAEGPFCTSIQEVAAFQITSIEGLGDNEYRLEGVASSSKKELKEFIKLLARYAQENHLERGQALKFWQWREGHLLWLPKGLKARGAILSFLKKSLGGVELKSNSQAAIEAYCLKRMPISVLLIEEKWRDPEEGKGLLEEGCQTIFEQLSYCPAKEFKDFSTSLLQLIDKTLIILGFPASVMLTGPKRHWIVEDGLGREQQIFALGMTEEEGYGRCRLKVGVEKILALLLEKTHVDLKQIEKAIEQDFQI